MEGMCRFLRSPVEFAKGQRVSVISDLSSMVLLIGQGNLESQEKECHRYRAVTSGLCHCTPAPALIHFHMTHAIGAVQHVLGADNLDRLAV